MVVVRLGVLILVLFACVAAASAASAASTTAVQTADTFIDNHPGRVDGADPNELAPAGQERGLGGVTVVRYDQAINGVPVLGGSVVVAVNAKRQVVGASGETLDAPLPSIGPSVSSADARQDALSVYSKSGESGLQAGDPQLIVYDPTILGVQGGGPAVLAWRVPMANVGGPLDDVYLDATTGALVTTISRIETVNLPKDRVVCDANDANAKVPCAAPYAATDAIPPVVLTGDVYGAFTNAGLTWDFYNALGRNSIDGAGMTLISTVRWTPDGAAYGNAYWDGLQMVYGAGFASALDVVAHELTHGVTGDTSKLIYANQSGAINEAMSDIMGELTEHSQPSHPSEWLMGEDLPIRAIRSMQNPPAFGDPDTMTSANYYTGFLDGGGVHRNSGVANKTAYLIAVGDTFNSQTIRGIGVTKSSYLWYQTELLLRPASGFSDLADALDLACATLVNTHGFTADDCVQVAKAETATELRTPAPNATSIPAECTVGTPTNAFNDQFAGGAANWTIAHTVGPAAAWYSSAVDYGDGVSSHWPLATSTSVRGVEPWVRTDSTIAMSTSVVVPADAHFRFTHHYDFEYGPSDGGTSTYDGGIVEYSVDNGAWTDAGGLPVINGYDGILDALGDLPADRPTLQGRNAFIGYSIGTMTTQFDLASLAGHTVRFRFRISTDAGNSADPQYGWFINSARIFGCGARSTEALVDPAPVVVTATAAAVAPQPPKSGTRVIDRGRGVVTASFPLVANRTFRVVASNGHTQRRGTCSRKTTIVMCTVSGLRSDRWRIVVKAYRNGVPTATHARYINA